MKKIHKNNKIVIFLFSFALIIRLIGVISVGEKEFPMEFGKLVPNLINGYGYSYYYVNSDGEISNEPIEDPQKVIPSAYMPPGYPFFLTAVCCFFGNGSNAILLIEILQAIIGAVTCLLLYKIIRIKFNDKIALSSSIIFSIYPILVFIPSQITAVNLYLFLNILLLFLLFKGEKLDKISYFVFAGLILGVLILSRGQVVIYFPFILLWIILLKQKNILKKAFIFILTTLIILTPWIIRNFVLFERLTPLTISGGINLWQGQNAQVTGTRSEYTDPPMKITESMQKKINELTPTIDYEIKLDNIYKDEAISFMKKNPGTVIKMALRKFVFYWGYYWGINFTYPSAKNPLYWLPWFILLPFFIVGIINTYDFKKYYLFYMYFIFSTIMIMIFFVLPRYRIFIIPLIIPFSVVGFINVSDIFRKIFNKKVNSSVKSSFD